MTCTNPECEDGQIPDSNACWKPCPECHPKTQAQLGYDKVLAKLSAAQKDQLILDCMDVLDGPLCWDAETIEFIAVLFTDLGFEIRDPNNESQYEPRELEE